MSEEIKNWSCPLPLQENDIVQLGHGSGGLMMQELIQHHILRHFNDPELLNLNDGAVIEQVDGRLAFTTDSYVVDPIFFPGGNIGDLAVNGTINDLAMCGAKPLYLSVSFIIEEGLPLDVLDQILASMQSAAHNAQVRIVTGDTKVVDRGKCDKIFINTAGIGVINHTHQIASSNIKPGDKLILSGTIGDHGIAILSQREGLSFATVIQSDTAPLHEIVSNLLATCGEFVHALRDPTRGGLAASLNEFATASSIEINICESALPLRPAVQNACELLGLDPLHIANEGKFLAAVADEKADVALSILKKHKLGQDAAIIGEVVAGSASMVCMQTRIGGWRIIDMPTGELLPRIC